MRAFLTYLVAWYNVWFTAPLAIVCLFALLQLAKGAMNFGDADANISVEIGTDTDTQTHRPSFRGIYGFLNAGRVPLMVVLMSLFATWGTAGLTANVLLDVPERPQWIWGTCVIALFSCFLGTRYISIALSKLFPQREKDISGVQLLGLSARVISGQVTTTFGTARLRVPDGPELTVSCRAKSDEVIPVKGDAVILINYDDTKRIFDVRKAESMDAD